jgi:selenocysteine-specific elongation factor
VRHLVLGTAGHIDHGKSALVHALTGIDPDRLKEEKRRGITIELGFADLDLGSERVLSFVDVPGHERFVRHMVAGATGIDAVLLVVAADQGVQPQTREHLDICRLLGLEHGVVALSKCDLVDAELQDVVALELQELLEGTFLEAAPMVHLSARNGEGLAQLRQALEALFDRIPQRSSRGLARLPVDRSFVLKGFGTVVTGTLVGGRLKEGEEIEVLPGGRRGRIRGLQVHKEKQSIAEAGRRTAVNLQGLDCEEVPRGATLAHPETLPTTRRVWARVTLLPSAPKNLRKGGPVRFHHGTFDRAARMRVLGQGRDGTLHVELHLLGAAVLVPGDRFVLRRPAPVDTVAGGTIVDIRPPAARLAREEWFGPDAVEPRTALRVRLSRAGQAGREASELGSELGLGSARVESELDALCEEGCVARSGSRWFDAASWREAGARALRTVKQFHEVQPLQPGISRETLRADTCPEMPQESWRTLLAELEKQGEIRLHGEAVARSDHRVELSQSEQELARRIGDRFRDGGLDPPKLEQVITADERARAVPIVDLMLARGELVRVQNRGVFHAEALETLRSKLREYAKRSVTIDVAGFKQLAGVTRKNAIPLLEHLDGERATRRVGDRREILLK